MEVNPTLHTAPDKVQKEDLGDSVREPDPKSVQKQPELYTSSGDNDAQMAEQVVPIVNNETKDDSDDDYDPEKAFVSSIDEQTESEYSSGKKYSKAAAETQPSEHLIDEDDDEYDPETVFSAAPAPKPAHGLPPKPSIQASHDQGDLDVQRQLREAFEAIMQSEVVQNGSFKELSESEQMKVIFEQLASKKLKLLEGLSFDMLANMNINQIFSANKHGAAKQSSPSNEDSRRLFLATPMTEDEEEEYQKFRVQLREYADTHSHPPGTIRLFVGNLSPQATEKDLYRVFSRYGQLHEISIRTSYAFVFFADATDCDRAIQTENNVPFFGRSWRLNASNVQNQKNVASENRGRERTIETDTLVNVKRKKQDGPVKCQIFVTNESSARITDDIKRVFSNNDITFQVEDAGDEDLADLISEVAYSGVLSACVVKESSVNLQMFEKTEDDDIKFDEYADITPQLASELLYNAKSEKPPLPLPSKPEAAEIPKYESIHSGRPVDNSRAKQARSAAHLRSRSSRSNKNQFADMYGRGAHTAQSSHASYPSPVYGQSYPTDSSYNVQAPASSFYPNSLSHQGQFSHYGSGGPSMSQNGHGYPMMPNQPMQYPTAHNTNFSLPHAIPLQNINNRQQSPDQIQLLQTLQNLDPATMQQMIILLQQQQQQQPQLNQHYSNQNNSPAPLPNTQVNTLLAQLQTENGQHSTTPQLNLLLETLTKLSRK